MIVLQLQTEYFILIKNKCQEKYNCLTIEFFDFFYPIQLVRQSNIIVLQRHTGPTPPEIPIVRQLQTN
jgi:hypothetical protein